MLFLKKKFSILCIFHKSITYRPTDRPTGGPADIEHGADLADYADVAYIADIAYVADVAYGTDLVVPCRADHA